MCRVLVLDLFLRFEHVLWCLQDHDTILFVSDKGLAYGIRAFQVPSGSRTAKGVPVPQVNWTCKLFRFVHSHVHRDARQIWNPSRR